MSLKFKTLLIASSCFLLTGISGSCESLAQSQQPWQSAHFRQHQLVGKIWSTKDQKFVEWNWLRSEVKSARFLLLGEIHTNSDHHRLQAELLSQMGKRPNPPLQLVIEMIPPSLAGVFDHFKANNKAPYSDLSKLGDALKWKKRGWGEWSKYSPIFQTALKINAKVNAGNIDRADTMRVGRKGLKAVSPSEKQNWSLDIDYTDQQKSTLNDLLFESHCKLVPKQAMLPMRLVQQVRDGAMAGAMLAQPKASAVLIAGSGHIRNDLAVPRILRAKAPDAKIVTVSFTEVVPDHKTPQKYELQSADKQPVFDYLFFTPKFEIKDHCAGLAKRFGKHKLKKPTSN